MSQKGVSIVEKLRGDRATGFGTYSHSPPAGVRLLRWRSPREAASLAAARPWRPRTAASPRVGVPHRPFRSLLAQRQRGGAGVRWSRAINAHPHGSSCISRNRQPPPAKGTEHAIELCESEHSAKDHVMHGDRIPPRNARCCGTPAAPVRPHSSG